MKERGSAPLGDNRGTVALRIPDQPDAIDLLIVVGKNSYDKTEIGSTMGLVAFSLMLVIAAFESRDEKGSTFRLETFDNRTVNITAVVEVTLAVLIAKGDFLPSLLGTVKLTGEQWLIAAAPALLLFIAWELGKAIARRRESDAQVTVPSPSAAVPVST